MTVCVYSCIHPCVYMYVLCMCVLCICDRIAGLDAHIKQIHFPPPIDRSIHGLTIGGYFTVHSSSVCFPHGLFLWPVWRPRVHGCSSNGPGAS